MAYRREKFITINGRQRFAGVISDEIELTKSRITTAYKRAVQKAMRFFVISMIADAALDTDLKKRLIMQRIKTKLAIDTTPLSFKFNIDIDVREMPLFLLGQKQFAEGVRTAQGKHRFPHAFIAKASTRKQARTYQRVGKERYPIHEKGVPIEASIVEAFKYYESIIENKLDEYFERELQRMGKSP